MMMLMSDINASEASAAGAPDLPTSVTREAAAASANPPLVRPAPPATAIRRKNSGVSPAQVLMVVASVATVTWGAWMTRSVMDLQAAGHSRFVKVQLQGLIGEYIRAQARSATPPQKVSAETSAFMGELDKVVKGLSSDGKIVLINEAIVAGDVPDVTDAVRHEVYSRVPPPRTAAPKDVESAMRSYLMGPGAPGNAAPAPDAATAALPGPTAAPNLGASNGLGN